MITQKKQMLEGLALLERQIDKALERHPEKHPSLEHSLTVIEEEFWELKQELFKKKPSREELLDEALDVAVTALRMVVDGELALCAART